jgi:hypothetical protein
MSVLREWVTPHKNIILFTPGTEMDCRQLPQDSPAKTEGAVLLSWTISSIGHQMSIRAVRMSGWSGPFSLVGTYLMVRLTQAIRRHEWAVDSCGRLLAFFKPLKGENRNSEIVWGSGTPFKPVAGIGSSALGKYAVLKRTSHMLEDDP